MSLPLVSLYCGQPIFGDPSSFVSTRLQGAVEATALYNSLMPAKIDAFLNLPPGTTQFGATSDGCVFVCSGIFYDLSAVGVAEQQDFMISFAGIASLWLRPTGLPWPGNAEFWKNSTFRASEVVFQPITSSPGNQFTCTYNMIIRTLGNS